MKYKEQIKHLTEEMLETCKSGRCKNIIKQTKANCQHILDFLKEEKDVKSE